MDSSWNEGENGKAYEKIIRFVKEQIIKGNIKKGERLPPERKLAEGLHVGRNSVREAMRTLSLMGFISSTQGSGNYISCDFEKSLTESLSMLFLLGQVEYSEIAEVRQTLETQSVRLASERIRPEHLQRLKEIVAEMRSGTDESYNAALDKELHLIIADASENWLILHILQALIETYDQFIGNLRTQIMMTECKEEMQHNHEEIVAALCEHDGKRAVQAMLAHFEMVDLAIKFGISEMYDTPPSMISLSVE